MKTMNNIIISGEKLALTDLIEVAVKKTSVSLTDDILKIKKINKAIKYVSEAIESGTIIYGVNTNFGGISNISIDSEKTSELQKQLLYAMKVGIGDRIAPQDVRIAMLILANNLVKGSSAVRQEIIERIILFLNRNVIPHVFDCGSIGASGDLVPLSYIAGTLFGFNPNYKVDLDDKPLHINEAYKLLNCSIILPRGKETLALINNSAMMTAIAARCVYDARQYLNLVMHLHAVFFQAMEVDNSFLNEFVHQCKPHPGQLWAAKKMRELLLGSMFIKQNKTSANAKMVQDRYSFRCLPQFMSPVVEGLDLIEKQIIIEVNSITDNPLIDVDAQEHFCGGNFLGQHVSVAMDQLRFYIGLLAKHLDVQIATLVSPEFNNGLNPSLIGNDKEKTNLGLKGLQILANSIMPVISYLGSPLADRFPTHAEQYNQNINSQGFMSAILCRQSLQLFQKYLAVSLIFAIQSIELRSFQKFGKYDPKKMLSPPSYKLYQFFYEALNIVKQNDRPYLWNNMDINLDDHIKKIVQLLQEYTLFDHII